MSNRMNDPAFRTNCAALWNVIAPGLSIDLFREAIRPGAQGKSILLGFVDLTIGFPIQGISAGWKVRGIAVKLLNGKPHLDFPQERGSDGKYYPTTFPKGEHGGELRQVLTMAVFQHGEVEQTMQRAASVVAEQQAAPAPASEVSALVAAPAPAPSTSVQNPFETA